MSNRICGEEVIIDKEKKFVFIHVPRTGGTSITKAFQHRNDQEVYNKVKKKWKERTDSLLYDHVDHCTMNILPSSFWNLYEYKFMFVRNTWDRLASYFFKIVDRPSAPGIPGPKEKDFDRFIKTIYANWSNNKSYFLFEKSQIDWRHDLIDEVINFEDVDRRWGYILSRCGVNYVRREHYNSRPERFKNIKKYRDMYTPELYDMVYDVFRKEIEYFNFRY